MTIVCLIGITYSSTTRYNTNINNVYNSGTITSATQTDSRGITYDKASINLGNISNDLASYSLSNWKMGDNNLPTFDW